MYQFTLQVLVPRCFLLPTIPIQLGIGGLIGFLTGGTIEKSFSTGNVSSPAKSAGGFIGGIEKGNIKKIVFYWKCESSSIVGGFAGYLVERDGSGLASFIEDCYSIGNVTEVDMTIKTVALLVP